MSVWRKTALGVAGAHSYFGSSSVIMIILYVPEQLNTKFENPDYQKKARTAICDVTQLFWVEFYNNDDITTD